MAVIKGCVSALKINQERDVRLAYTIEPIMLPIEKSSGPAAGRITGPTGIVSLPNKKPSELPPGPEMRPDGPPIEIETMLRMYLLQCWFNLSDEGVEEAIYDSYAMRKFMGINFFEQDVPDAATLLKFRHLLEEKGIGKLFFDAINRCLERAGRMMRGGSIVDATLLQLLVY